MPELEINLDALAHNLRLVRRQEQAWGFRFLPVLKMVASHPDVVDFLRTQGYARYGIADMTEHLLYGQEPPARTGRVLINLAPPDRADDVVRLFERSAFSCETTFRALDAAARAAGLHHEGTVLSARPLRIVFPGFSSGLFASCPSGRFLRIARPACGVAVLRVCVGGDACPSSGKSNPDLFFIFNCKTCLDFYYL